MVSRLGFYSLGIQVQVLFLAMSLFIQNNFFYYVPKGIDKFILLIISRIKALLQLNITRINKKYFFNLLDSHIIHYELPITLTYALSFGSWTRIFLLVFYVMRIGS